MSHVIHLSDERYQAIDIWLIEKQREAEFALVDAAFTNDPE